MMEQKHILLLLVALLAMASCNEKSGADAVPTPEEIEADLSLGNVARILSALPLGQEHLEEVYDAVNSSWGNGYDEEYMMSDLFQSPGAGVGSGGAATKAGGYACPLRDLFEDYFDSMPMTKAGASAKAYIEALSSSDMQIYWPYSDSWDGERYPIVTFDPGYGAESNYGYEVKVDEDGVHVVDSVFVDEAVAMQRPVWVINRNDDSAFSPAELISRSSAAQTKADEGTAGKILKIKSFTMLHNYDSWFGGGSEFFIKCGAVDGFKASKDEDLKNYSPTVTDFEVNVRRKEIKIPHELNCILLTNFTPQMETLAFLVTEDDGGTTTSWDASATVKYNSKQYGFEIKLPYKDKDDIVWRGQLSRSFFFPEEVGKKPQKTIAGRFGDVEITFELE